MPCSRFAALVLAACLAGFSLTAQETEPLKTVRLIQLPAAIKGPFDHLTLDAAHNRLFATPEDYGAVLVIDLSSGQVIHEIHGIARPHAVLYREDLNRIYVTDGTDGALKTFEGSSYRLLQTTPLLKDADSIGYDPSRKLLYIDSGGKDEGQKFSMVSVVDTANSKKLADIKIEGETLEAMALDVFRPRLYVNNKAKGRVEVVDRWKGAVIAAWPVTLAKDNVAMGLDEARQRLFVGCRSGKMVVFDTNTGKELLALPIVNGVDDLVYDPASRRIYAAGSGMVSVFRQIDADHYEPYGGFSTGPGAKTALLAPAVNRYFAAVPQHGSQNAAILEMEPLGVPTSPAPEVPHRAAVDAPAAQNLLLATMSAHPYLRKMGLHGAPLEGSGSVILANVNASRIGIASTEGDLSAVKDGKTYCVKRDDGSYYNLKLPMVDAAGRKIGILVMEIPYTSATSVEDASAQAEQLRAELAAQIPNRAALFQYALNVSAPTAQKLLEAAMAAHPELQKMGLHVTPPGAADNVIIASNIASKIGKKSSDADMAVAQSRKPTVKKVEGDSPFYDLALPLSDASGASIGMIVMELRASGAKDESDALRKAAGIRDQMQRAIPAVAALFER